LFEYNYNTDETFKYSDTGDTPSEYILMENGDVLSIISGDIFVSKNFTTTRLFNKDIRLTSTDEYEYSPLIADKFLIFRRTGNYFIKYIDSSAAEMQLTKDESDTVSYQILAFSHTYGDSTAPSIRILFARYDKSSRDKLYFPNYNHEFVTIDKQLRGESKVKLEEMEIKPSDKNLTVQTNLIYYPDSVRYSTQYAVYSPDTKVLVLDIETLDRHDRKMFNYTITDKKIKEIYSESDTAWFERHGNATRFISEDEIIFESEISGYNNLYKIKSDGSGFTKVTGGSYTILESIINRKQKKIYFTANAETPVEYNIYETDFSGSYLTKLTNNTGDYEDLSISQDDEWLFCKYSYITKPSELYSIHLSDRTEKQITNTINPKFTNISWDVPEVITFNNKEDGQLIYGFLYKPKDFSPKKKYPLICFVHGAGYLQNVTKGFSPYSDNFMVNTFLTSQGYMIFECDFRGSAGYGKDFRNKTHRNLGYWEVSDYMSGIDYLDDLGMINRERVGIYGGSYGGFTTLMALFRHPEYFKAGVALRAVANWGLYYYGNRWFTLGRLGDYSKAEDKEYYKTSSPITYAPDLSVPLLLTHGMLDDNVFFQDAVQLTQKLLDNKKDFEVMFYPKEYHSFHLQSSWLDQYKRIYKFFERYLNHK
jgi:dipeptidyl aminopeptidase/acylaminoacyl peptidase